MKAIAVTEFKAHCLSLLEAVARTGEPLLVTKRGKPLARVLPSGVEAACPQETLAGTVTIIGDVIASVLPPATAWNAVRGEMVSERPKKRR